MWKVKLPDTGDIDAQLNDALIQKDGEVVYGLSAEERAAIHALYADYDQRLGEPDPALTPPALNACADALLAAYGQVQKGGRLAKLRSSLLNRVMECPLCGSGDAKTLDHHLPKDNYRALAINPRNLIPCCQPCNRAKGMLVAVAGQGLIHAYFQALPATTFLIAHATYAAGSLTIEFAIDPGGLPAALYARLAFQLERLKLTERHPNAINIFLFSLKTSFRLFKGKPDERDQVRQFMLDCADTLDADLGLNHWRPAVLRALANCGDFLNDPWTYFDNPPAVMNAG